MMRYKRELIIVKSTLSIRNILSSTDNFIYCVREYQKARDRKKYNRSKFSAFLNPPRWKH